MRKLVNSRKRHDRRALEQRMVVRTNAVVVLQPNGTIAQSTER